MRDQYFSVNGNYEHGIRISYILILPIHDYSFPNETAFHIGSRISIDGEGYTVK